MKNPFVSVTVCWVSSASRNASLVGLPMTKVPGGIQTMFVVTTFVGTCCANAR